MVLHRLSGSAVMSRLTTPMSSWQGRSFLAPALLLFKEEWSACTQGHNNQTEVVNVLRGESARCDSLLGNHLDGRFHI